MPLPSCLVGDMSMAFQEQHHRLLSVIGDFGGDTIAQKVGFVFAAGNLSQFHSTLREFNAEWADVAQFASGVYVIGQLGYFVYKVIWGKSRE
jgi:hypothetical protein